MMLERLGTLHLDEAAALAKTTRKYYIESFLRSKDPIAAERMFFDNTINKKLKVTLMMKKSNLVSSNNLQLQRKVDAVETSEKEGCVGAGGRWSARREVHHTADTFWRQREEGADS
jgi:hypothetical protein